MKLDSTISTIVVGGASGMGRASVEALTQLGVKVSILDLNADKGAAVAKATGANFYQIDITNEESVLQGFAAARQAAGQERILICTPGGGGISATAWREGEQTKRHSYSKFKRIVDLNLNGTFLCASISAQGMLDLPVAECGDRGVILMTSSTASQDGQAATGAYAAAKAGINGLTLSMARDLACEAIRVNTILPGNFETPLLDTVPEDYKDNMRNWNLHPKRFGQAHEYASLALQIIQNSYFNATCIRLDGGARV